MVQCVYERSCCACCVCYDRLRSDHVLVITSSTARRDINIHELQPTHFPKKSAWAVPIFCIVEPVTLKQPCLFHNDFNRVNHDFLHSGTPL